MGAMSTKGPLVFDSDEVEALACRKALEFAIDVGFSELVIEGDSAKETNSIRSSGANQSWLGHVGYLVSYFWFKFGRYKLGETECKICCP